MRQNGPDDSDRPIGGGPALSLGLVDWFAAEKGFGVAVSPEAGEVFLHVSNFEDPDLTPSQGTPLLFEIGCQRGKTCGLSIRQPAGDADLRWLLRRYGLTKEVSLNVKGRRHPRRGHSITREADSSFDPVKVALMHLVRHAEADDIWPTLLRFVEDDLARGGMEEYKRFIRFVAMDLGGVDLWQEHSFGVRDKLPEQFAHTLAIKALDAAPLEIRFSVWKALREEDGLMGPHSYDREILGFMSDVEDERVLDLDQAVLDAHMEDLSPEDLAYIGRMEEGAKRLRRLLGKMRTTVLASYGPDDQDWVEALVLASEAAYAEDEQETHNGFCLWLLGHCDDSLLATIFSEKLVRRRSYDPQPLPIAAAVAAEVGSNRSAALVTSEDDQTFLAVMKAVREKLNEEVYAQVVGEVNGELDEATTIRLWQQERYFDPAPDLLHRFAGALSLADLRAAPGAWQRQYYEERTRPHLPGSDLVDLAMLSGFCRENESVVLPLVASNVEPTEHRVALLLKYPEHRGAAGWNPSALVDALRTPDRFRLLLEAFQTVDALGFGWGTGLFGDSDDRERVRERVARARDREMDADVVSSLLDGWIGYLDGEDAADVLTTLLIRADDYGLAFDDILRLITRSPLAGEAARAVYDRAYDDLADSRKVRLWMEGKVDRSDLDMLHMAFGTLSHTEQRLFLRRLFVGAARREYALDLAYLESLLAEAGDIDLSVRVVVRALQVLRFEGQLLGAGALSDVISDYVGDRTDLLVQVGDLFDSCSGRSIVDSDPYSRSQGQWFAVIEGGSFPVSNDNVVIGDQHLPFDRDAKTVEVGGRTFRFRWRKQDTVRAGVPKGITFCEGREANKRDEWTGKPFHWCCNKPCFELSRSPRHHLAWRTFAFTDFARVLDLPLDDEGYARFLAMLNRTNRLLKRLNCTGCGRLLRPVRSSAFAFYRTTRFHCTNEDCEERGEEIYLTHCLNWKCNGVIDSRVSKRCSNGWYICAEKDCGHCCSNEKLRQRLDTLRRVGAFNSSNPSHTELQRQVDEGLGHF